jgi:hypothetical protein
VYRVVLVGVVINGMCRWRNRRIHFSIGSIRLRVGEGGEYLKTIIIEGGKTLKIDDKGLKKSEEGL